jgi:hypothetical protein
MNWEIKHIVADNYVKVTCDGIFSIESHPECFRKLFTSAFWKPGTNLLFDNRNFDFGQMNIDKLRMGSNYYQKVSDHLGKGKVALLMNTPLGYGIGRQFQLLSEEKVQTEIRVFKDEQEAIGWLTEEKL